MKKQLLSLSLVLCLILSTFSPSAVEISFEDFYIDDENIFQEYFLLEKYSYIEDTPIFENSSLKAGENYTTENLFSEPRITLLNSENENPIKNLNIPENLTYTTVDITDVFTGDVISHDCNLYLVSNFDETEHWNECSICGKILNKESHSYTDNGWTGGSASNCADSNVHLFTCNCGYSYSNTTGRKAHSYRSPASNHSSNCVYYTYCKNCIYSTITYHECVKSDGSRISCGNPGKCALCGYTYVAEHGGSVSVLDFPSDIHCTNCSKFMGTILMGNIYNNSEGSVVLNSNIEIEGSYSSLSYKLWNPIANYTTTSTTINGLNLTSNITFKSKMEYTTYLYQYYKYYQDGIANYIYAAAVIAPEYTPPVITNIISNSEDWTTDSTISISGTENYCNSVNLTLKDTNENIYAENVKASVTNKNWNYEIKPSLESKENTEFILQVTDAIGNTTEQSFYLSKIDAIPPKAIETDKLNTAWSKTKDYVFTSSDYGIGNVSNSVISTDNYEPAIENENIFYKGYTFTGDVYGETLVPVYMKDGLGNSNVEFVSVSNLDNTAPSIENIVMNKSLHNTEIVISANDMNEKLSATGSGVTGYAISTKNEIPDTFQEDNTFNLTEAGTYYIFITDLVGNITSRELNIPVQYKVTINPDGGTWKGSTEPQEIETDEPINLYPEPEKEGYTFKEWKISGEGEITPDRELIIGGDVKVTPIWEANKYEVIFIDYNVTNKEELNRVTKELTYNTLINGFDLGSDTSDNVYYPQYRLISSTEIKVSTNPENNIVYRYFEFCYTEKESHLNFNDNNNLDGLCPETYKLKLILEDGTPVQEVTLPTTEPDYTFENLPKYDEQGKEYNYKIIPIISDRYIPTEPDEEGNITIIYNNPECSINIPKITTLDGKNGDLTYTIQITSNLFYKDKIILIPDENVTLTDGVKNMVATITQDKTEFNKDDELQVTGKIQVNKKHFAGTWTGTFSFKIKYEVSN